MSKELNLENVRIYSSTKNDIIDAINLISEKVYFSDDVNFESYKEGNLLEVSYRDNISYPFLGACGIGAYKYFIIAKDVKFKEKKKLRPYRGVDEFSNETGCEVVGGDVLTIRNKKGKQEKLLLFTGYSDTAVHLGAYLITFTNLLCDYEYTLDGSEWLPFGIEC